jgi:hypothetical protein
VYVCVGWCVFVCMVCDVRFPILILVLGARDKGDGKVNQESATIEDASVMRGHISMPSSWDNSLGPVSVTWWCVDKHRHFR